MFGIWTGPDDFDVKFTGSEIQDPQPLHPLGQNIEFAEIRLTSCSMQSSTDPKMAVHPSWTTFRRFVCVFYEIIFLGAPDG